MPNYTFVFEDLTSEVDTDLRIEGRIPEGLNGQFVVIGSTGTRIGSTQLHALDGDGRVTSVRLQNGRARMQARMVATPLRTAEQARGAMIQRRQFTNLPRRWSNFLNVNLGNNAWHNVVRWGRHLVACHDPGFFLLNPDTLETRGPAPIQPQKGATFGPMPRRDPRTGRYLLFELSQGLHNAVRVREIDDNFVVALDKMYKLPKGVLLHDIAFTDHYYIVLQWSSLNIPRALWGARPAVEAVDFDPAKSPVIHLLPRDGSSPIAVPIPGGRQHAHMWNAFEDGNKIIIDAIGYQGVVTFRSLYPPSMRMSLGFTGRQVTPTAENLRYTADPAAATMTVRKLADVPCEPPEINPSRRGRKHRYGWAPCPGQTGDEEDTEFYYWFHGLASYDFDEGTVQQWDAGPDKNVSAAAFAPRPSGVTENDGWVFAWIQDLTARTSSVGIFDAKQLSAGPVARLCAPPEVGLVGLVSHASFC